MLSRRLLLPALAGSLLAAAPASAATLTTDKPCYVERTPVTYTGAGFTPGANWFIEAQAVYANGMVAPDGSFSIAQAAPLNANENTRAKSFSVDGYEETSDGNVVRATATYKIVSLLVQLARGAGNPTGTTKWGFSGFRPGKAIFVHVKRGSHVWTQRAGRGNQPCGILHKRLRRLPAVPSGSIRSGKYKVQIDNHRRLRKQGLRYTFTYRIY